MSDETIRKAEKDYKEELDSSLPEIEKLSLQQPNEALAQLLAFEKKVRQAGDLPSSKRVLVAIAQLLTPTQAGDWYELCEQVLLLVKKHGQSKEAIISLVQEVINRLDSAPTRAAKMKTIDTLRTVTDGRIYLELERARVTQILARIEVQENNDFAKAADLMGELQVETFGSMEMTEKIDFILEQIELYIKKQDYTHASIVSRKILVRYFAKAKEDPRVAAQKVRFYELKVEIALHSNDYLEVCQNLRHIFDTPRGEEAEAAEAKQREILGNMVLFAVLAPYDNLQSDVLHHLARESDLPLMPLFDQIVSMFTTDELIRWPKMTEVFGGELRKHSVFEQNSEAGDRHWDDLRKRIIEHNIRVVAKFYTRITITGLSELLDLTLPETEEVLAKLVVSGMVWARIDRPKRIVSFAQPQNVDDVLNGWSNNTAQLLEHVETICHLIAKEEMLHGGKSEARA